MHLSCQGCFCFRYFDIFLRGSSTVNMLLQTSLVWNILNNLTTSVSNILHSPKILLSCQTIAYIVNLYFFNLSLFLRFKIHTGMCLSCQYATNLPLFQTFSIHLTCVYHVDNFLNMPPLAFHFHMKCTQHFDNSLSPYPL